MKYNISMSEYRMQVWLFSEKVKHSLWVKKISYSLNNIKIIYGKRMKKALKVYYEVDVSYSDGD